MNRKRFKRGTFATNLEFSYPAVERKRCCEAELGQRLRGLREESGLSLRALADKSGISVNTVSLIENGKCSPSVSTLQKIALALNVSLVAFFIAEREEKKVSFTQQGDRKKFPFENSAIEDLGEGLSDGCFEPFVVTLDPGANSGIDSIIHTGYEFVYCLKGRIAYIIENTRYILEPGDSLFFEANLPHCWQNLDSEASQKLLVLCPSDIRDRSLGLHFTNP